MNQIDLNDLAFIVDRYGMPKGWVPGLYTRGRIHPHVTQAYMGEGRFVSVFHAKPVYYETKQGHWRPVSEVAVHHGNRTITLSPLAVKLMHPRYMRWLQSRQRILKSELLIDYGRDAFGLQPRHFTYATISTFYPDANVESTSVDGYLKIAARTEDWATIRANTTSSTAPDSSASGEMAETYARSSSNLWDELTRSAYVFDTSGIPDGDTINSGTFSLYITSKGDIAGALDVALVSKTTASNTALATSDFNISSFGSTRLATDLSVASISTSAYNDWTLNASGLSHISKTSVTKFGLLLAEDRDNSSPTWSSLVYGHITGYFADQTGTGNDPKLVLNHTGATTTYQRRPNILLMGVS